MVAALYPVEKYTERESSYPHYMTVLNLTDTEFPITSKDISKFERLNMVSINVYSIENKQVLPLRLTDDKKKKHVNFLYVQDSHNDNLGHFACIKNLARLVSLQITIKEKEQEIFLRPVSIIRKTNRKTVKKEIVKNDFSIIYRCLHYFGSCEKLQLHEVDCKKINDCVIRLPSEDDKWLEFGNHCNKERIPFIVYADLECVLRKTESDKEDAY